MGYAIGLERHVIGMPMPHNGIAVLTLLQDNKDNCQHVWNSIVYAGYYRNIYPFVCKPFNKFLEKVALKREILPWDFLAPFPKVNLTKKQRRLAERLALQELKGEKAGEFIEQMDHFAKTALDKAHLASVQLAIKDKDVLSQAEKDQIANPPEPGIPEKKKSGLTDAQADAIFEEENL